MKKVIEIYIKRGPKFEYFGTTWRFKTCREAKKTFLEKYNTLGVLPNDVKCQIKKGAKCYL